MHDQDDDPSNHAGPSKYAMCPPTSTPAVPDRYPNLETATQIDRALTRPRQFRRVKSCNEDCLRVLNKTFGKPTFRGRQKEIMEAAIRGADVLVVAPTGMGKSLCFQVPAVADSHGITLVISPLLSLMKNQVEALRKVGVKVHLMCSETPFSEKLEIDRDLASGHPLARLLYITPESLFSNGFMKSLKAVVGNKELRRLVVDEAHCISEWGNSFRPEYGKIGYFRHNFPLVPIMALTASATANVERDIINSLRLSEEHLFRCVEPFNRSNLYYEIKYRPEPDQDRVHDISKTILQLHRNSPPIDPADPTKKIPVCGIVYCRSRASCDFVSDYLRKQGVRSKPFHRGIKPHQLDETLLQWLKGVTVDCVVATIAFGMGIDKPDVRYVIHFDLPKSFEGYYQETGRAGRDGHLSRCILYYSREDAIRVRRFLEMEKSKSTKKAEEAGSDSDEPDLNRGVNSFKAIQHFAESTTLCRHIAICRFFGEKIDDKDVDIKKLYCQQMCDICKDPAKVALRAQDLSPEVVIASQAIITSPAKPRRTEKRRERDPIDREEPLRAINPVAFYGNGGDPWKDRMGPPPIPAHQTSGGGVAFGFGEGKKTTGAAKKIKTAPPNPYAQSPAHSSGTPRYTVAGSQKRSQHAFKTPFMNKSLAGVTATQRTRKLEESSSGEFEFEFEDSDIKLEGAASQKIQMSLRTSAFKSIIKNLQRALSDAVWNQLGMAASAKTKDKNSVVCKTGKALEWELVSWSTTPDGYHDRLSSLLRILADKRLWSIVLSGVTSNHGADEEEVGNMQDVINHYKRVISDWKKSKNREGDVVEVEM